MIETKPSPAKNRIGWFCPTLAGRPVAAAWAALRGTDPDLVAVVALFLVMRVGMAFFLMPGGHFFRGDADFLFFRRFAELSTGGYYPYLDYWMEYPPIFPWLVIGVYRLSLLLPAWPDPLIWFQVILASALGLVDVVNLGLVYLIASRLRGAVVARRAAIYYALLFFPAYAALGWFDALPLCLLLLSVWLGLSERPALAGLVAGLGLMTKAIPAVAAPIGVLGARTWRGRLRYAATFALTAASIAIPFALANPTMSLASVRAMFGRSSWESVWSCLESYCGFGIVPEIADRFDPAQATRLFHPQTLPWTAITAVLALLLLALYTRRLRWQDPAVAVTGVALSLNLLLLFSKGYSPQFLIYPLALLIILKPNVVGVLQACLLTAVSLVEYPFAIAVVFGNSTLQALAVGTRTLLLVLLTLEYAVSLWESSGRERVVLKRVVVGAFFVCGALGFAAGAAMVGSQFVASNPTRAVAERIAAFRQPNDAVAASSREAFYRTRPVVPASGWLLAEEDNRQWPVPLAQRLDALLAGRSAVWLILDQGTGNADARAMMTERLDRWGERATDEWIGQQYRLIGYVAHDQTVSSEVPLDVTLGGSLAVLGRGPLAEEVAPGQGLRLLLQVRCDAPPGGDLKTFVHLVDQSGKLAAQTDKPFTWRGQPATTCRAGDSVWIGSDLLVPATAAPGVYSIQMGFYDAASGARPKITAGSGVGGDFLPLADVRVTTPNAR